MKYLEMFLNVFEFGMKLLGICTLALIFACMTEGDWQVKAKPNVNEPILVFCGRNFVDEKVECEK